MTSPTTVPNVYRRAAAVIREGGLTKNEYEDGWGAHCTIGAVVAAKYGKVDNCHGTLYDPSEVGLLSDMLGGLDDRFLNPGQVVAAWNDQPERTPEDVITLLEQAAEKLEADQ